MVYAIRLHASGTWLEKACDMSCASMLAIC